jgi:hypothetical protein
MGVGISLPSPVLVTVAIPKQCFDDVHCTGTIRKISLMRYLGALIQHGDSFSFKLDNILP